MIYLILVALVGIATGCFLYKTLLAWVERIEDWRKPAL